MGARARRPLLVLAVAVSLVVAACGSSTPSPAASAGGSDAATQGSSASLPTPSAGGPSSTAAIGPGGTGSGWSLAAIEQPAAVGAAASGAAPGLFCSPCHSTVTTYVDAVEPGGPGLVAVGLVFPGTYAAAWTSVDGLTWRRTPDLGAPGTRAFALASGRGGLVAVGDQGHVPAAWWSADGQAWHAGRSPAVPAAGSGQLLAITGSPDGYVAGGWLQEPDGRSSAALWTSPDGRTWTSEVPLPAGSGGQVHGLASDASAEVAVGVGSVDAAGAVASDRAAAWVSTDGRTWRSATIDGSDGARMEAVIVTPAGWLAVGSRDGGMSAASWTSVDGLTWRAAPESPALRNLGGSVRMLGVAAEGTGYIAVGWRDSVGNGNAVAWTSPDGSTWARMTDDDSFSGGGMAAVTSHDGRVVAVGTVGWPDDHFATIWVHAVSGG